VLGCCGNNTNPCANSGGDSDGDGVCNNNDCQPNNPSFPATPGTACNDGNANTISDVIQADGCTCAGITMPSVCDTKTNDCVTVALKGITTNANGTKTYEFKVTHNCNRALSYAAFELPSGVVAIDRQNGGTYNGWNASYLIENPTNNPFYSIKFETIGEGIKGGQMETFTYTLPASAPVLTSIRVQVKSSTNTYLVTLNTANCTSGGGGGGTPNCAKIGITTQPGKINVSGLDGAPITSVQIFNAAWQTLHNCFANCGSPIASYTVPAGSYNVYVKYYSATYQLICEKQQTVTVASSLESNQGEALKFVATKQEEHTTVFWLHNGGYHVVDYVLERSADGNEFEAIVSKASLGGQREEYYEDYDFEPFTGDNYYRLKMVNDDGTFGYSEIQKVYFHDILDYQLFPNPANGFVKANLETVIGATDVNITIFNNLGLEVKRFQLDEVWGKYYQMDIRDLYEGHYVVWLNVPGKRPIAKKMVVGRI